MNKTALSNTSNRLFEAITINLKWQQSTVLFHVPFCQALLEPVLSAIEPRFRESLSTVRGREPPLSQRYYLPYERSLAVLALHSNHSNGVDSFVHKVRMMAKGMGIYQWVSAGVRGSERMGRRLAFQSTKFMCVSVVSYKTACALSIHGSTSLLICHAFR